MDQPTADDLARDLAADLECVKTWDWTTAELDWPRSWAAGLRRALAAEARVAELAEALRRHEELMPENLAHCLAQEKRIADLEARLERVAARGDVLLADTAPESLS